MTKITALFALCIGLVTTTGCRNAGGAEPPIALAQATAVATPATPSLSQPPTCTIALGETRVFSKTMYCRARLDATPTEVSLFTGTSPDECFKKALVCTCQSGHATLTPKTDQWHVGCEQPTAEAMADIRSTNDPLDH
jgi:hypothetical protein